MEKLTIKEKCAIKEKCYSYFASRKGAGYCARCSRDTKELGGASMIIAHCKQCLTMWATELQMHMTVGCETLEVFKETYRKLTARHFTFKPVNERYRPRVTKAKKEEEIIDQECCVCLEEKKVMSFVPCGHLAICKTCSTSKKWDKCPMCSQECSTVIQIFS